MADDNQKLTLGEKITQVLHDVLQPVADLMLVPIRLGLEFGLEALLDLLGRRFAPIMTPLVDTLNNTGQVPPELQPLLDEIKKPDGEVASLLSLSAAQGGLGLISGSIVTTLTSGLQNSLNAAVQPSLLDPESLIKAKWRGLYENEYDLWQEWRWTGLNEKRQGILEDVYKPLLGIDTLRFIYNRFPAQSNIVDDTLSKMGFTLSDILSIKQTFALYPSIQDLIHMAVREAFSPDIIAKFGTMEDFPADFADEAQKQGLDPEWARRYWAAHWALPSVNQGFEMYHRGHIDDKELDTLMRVLDIMPYWRERLKQIAYNPLTRVDVRRMHALGVLNREKVKRAYLDIGYNDANAELMTQFTEQYNQVSERELTKTEILSLFKQRAMEYDEAYELLTELGYDGDTAAYLLEEQSAALTEATRALSLTQIKQLALSTDMTRGEASGRLAALGYDAEDIENIFKLWELEAVPNIRQPSRTDLESFWKKNIINDDTWYNRMLLLGYEEEVVLWFYLEMSD